MPPLIKYTSFILMSLFATVSVAHDFWLQANTFQNDKAPVVVPVKFLIGHADNIDPWTLNWDRIVALRSYSENGYSDQVSGIVANNALTRGLARVSLETDGTHVIGFESYHSLSTLAADKFTSYAEKEGLALVLAERERFGQQSQPGREIYSRKAKTLIQIGDSYTANATKPIGHMLEIVPLKHPYVLNDAGELPVQVLFRGKPLENALIDLTALTTDLSQSESKIAHQLSQYETAHRTDSDGKASFKIEQNGNWKLNVIWAVPNGGSNSAEFETYFSSLTFGY